MFLVGCETSKGINSEEAFEYFYKSPDKKYILPKSLKEISGLTIIDSTTAVCVQDENGILFFYDLLSSTIKTQKIFAADGDYEGVACVNNSIYVLRSDGVLFEIVDYRAEKLVVTIHQTGIPVDDYEGLCYDVDNNRLLIACKGRGGKIGALKDQKEIYDFNLGTKRASSKPVMELSISAVKKFALKNYKGFPVKEVKKTEVKEADIKFLPSEIGIHPISKKLYLLSAADRCLFIFNMKGEVESIEQLKENLFHKSEGLSFFKNGDMLISNEADDEDPILLRLNYRK